MDRSSQMILAAAIMAAEDAKIQFRVDMSGSAYSREPPSEVKHGPFGNMIFLGKKASRELIHLLLSLLFQTRVRRKSPSNSDARVPAIQFPRVVFQARSPWDTPSTISELDA